MLAFFRNDMGLRRQQRPDRLQGHPRLPGAQSDGTRAALFFARRSRWPIFLICRADRLLALRQGADRGARRREAAPASSATGSSLQAVRLRAVGHAGGRRRRALCAAGRHHQPQRILAGNSIEAVIWVAVGGRGTLIGAGLGAFVSTSARPGFTGALPEVWLFALGALFIAVTLFLPKGIVGCGGRSAIAARAPPAKRAPRRTGADEPDRAERARRRCSISTA
jgi:urea transport system permease protein